MDVRVKRVERFAAAPQCLAEAHVKTDGIFATDRLAQAFVMTALRRVGVRRLNARETAPLLGVAMRCSIHLMIQGADSMLGSAQ